MTNKELAKLINKTPLKVRATIAGTEAYVNIEKQDLKAMLLENPECEQFSVDVNNSGIYIDAIW